MNQVGVETYQISDHGDAVSLANVGLRDPPDTAVSPRKFYWKRHFL
jgi:hypothetical protein